MPANLAELEKRLASLEEAHKKTTRLALATDQDVQREKSRHQLILHLYGAAVDPVEALYSNHKQEKENNSKKQRKTDEEEFVSAGEEECVQAEKWAATNVRRAALSWKAKLWKWLLDELKKRATAASSAGRAAHAVQATQKLFSMEACIVLHDARFHTKEPIPAAKEEDDDDDDDDDDGNSKGKAWHCTLDFTYGEQGVQAMQLFAWDLQAFSYGEVTFHQNLPRPGKLAADAAKAAHLEAPGQKKGKAGGKGKGKKAAKGSK